MVTTTITRPVLVTGGCGYIGSHVVKLLNAQGRQVHVLDDLSAGRRENLPDAVGLTVGSVVEGPDVARALLTAERRFGRRVGAVLHFAALKSVSESMREPSRYYRVNVLGTLALLQSMKRLGVRELVFSSTAAVYGAPRRARPVIEHDDTEPANCYGQTKLIAEDMIRSFERAGDLRAVCLRYFNAAGHDRDGELLAWESCPQSLIPVALEAAAGLRGPLTIYGADFETRDGTGERDYVHVEDLARAHARALEWLSAGNCGATLNLGSGRTTSVLEILEAIERLTGVAVPHQIGARRPGELATISADSNWAQELLGWRARCSSIDTIIESSWRVLNRVFPVAIRARAG